jgi:dTDP-4-amino-4,6-dideoxygalactose transaminase
MNVQYLHEIVGYNYRMTDLAAAIGLVQLSRLPEWTAQRIQNASYFNEHIRGMTIPTTRLGSTHVYHQYTLRVPSGLNRDTVVQRLVERGIGARVYYPIPIHQQPVFRAMPDYSNVHLPETEQASREVFSLPVHPALSQEERGYIVEEVNALC